MPEPWSPRDLRRWVDGIEMARLVVRRCGQALPPANTRDASEGSRRVINPPQVASPPHLTRLGAARGPVDRSRNTAETPFKVLFNMECAMCQPINALARRLRSIKSVKWRNTIIVLWIALSLERFGVIHDSRDDLLAIARARLLECCYVAQRDRKS